jgi:hypothetical protein
VRRIRLGEEEEKTQSRERRKNSANVADTKGNGKMHATRRTVDPKKRSRECDFSSARVIVIVGKTIRRRPRIPESLPSTTPKIEILPKSTYYLRKERTEWFLELCWFLVLLFQSKNFLSSVLLCHRMRILRWKVHVIASRY